MGRGQIQLLAGVTRVVSSPRPVDLSVAAIPFKALESCLAAATALTGEKAAALHSPRLTSELGVLMLLLTTTLSAVPPVPGKKKQ